MTRLTHDYIAAALPRVQFAIAVSSWRGEGG